MKIVRSPVRSVVSNAVRSVVSTIRRYFLDFNGTSSDAELETAFEPAGDFEVEIDFSTTLTSGNPRLLSTANSGVNGIDLYLTASTGTLQAQIKISGVDTYLGTAETGLNAGKLHKAKLRRANNDFYLSVDDGAEVTTNRAVTATDFKYIGSSNGGNYFGGVIANVKLTDLDTPANSLNFRLDRPTGNYELPVNNVTGSELLTNPDFSDGTTGYSVTGGTISASSGELTVNATGTAFAYQSFPTIVGKLYKAHGTIVSNTGGGFRGIRKSDNATNSSNLVDIVNNTIATKTVFFTATSTTTYIVVQQNNSGDTVTVSNLGVKQVTNALVYNNIAEADQFQAQLTGLDWVATDEQFENGDFASSSGWTLDSGGTITNGQLVLVSSQGNNYRPSDSGVTFPLGIPFLVSISVSSYVSGDLNFQLASGGDTSGNLVGVNSDGITKGIRTVSTESSNRPNIYTSTGNAFTGNIDNVSAKRILEAP
jgi:hypothetical protein